MRIEGQIKKLRQQMKLLNEKIPKKTTVDKFDIKTGRNRLKDKGERERETQKVPGQSQEMQAKQDLSK